MAENTTLPVILDHREILRLEKNTKGYNWEIKVIIDNKDDADALKRLDALNEMLKKSYGESN